MSGGPVTVEFFGGPKDGELTTITMRTPIIEVSLCRTSRYVERHADGVVKTPMGRYQAYLRVMAEGPYPYLWQGER